MQAYEAVQPISVQGMEVLPHLPANVAAAGMPVGVAAQLVMKLHSCVCRYLAPLLIKVVKPLEPCNVCRLQSPQSESSVGWSSQTPEAARWAHPKFQICTFAAKSYA